MTNAPRHCKERSDAAKRLASRCPDLPLRAFAFDVVTLDSGGPRDGAPPRPCAAIFRTPRQTGDPAHGANPGRQLHDGRACERRRQQSIRTTATGGNCPAVLSRQISRDDRSMARRDGRFAGGNEGAEQEIQGERTAAGGARVVRRGGSVLRKVVTDERAAPIVCRPRPSGNTPAAPAPLRPSRSAKASRRRW